MEILLHVFVQLVLMLIASIGGFVLMTLSWYYGKVGSESFYPIEQEQMLQLSKKCWNWALINFAFVAGILV